MISASACFLNGTLLGSRDLLIDGAGSYPLNVNFNTNTGQFAAASACDTVGFGSGGASQGVCIGGSYVGGSFIDVRDSTLTATLVSAVPLPAAGLLLLSGLGGRGGVAGLGRRKKAWGASPHLRYSGSACQFLKRGRSRPRPGYPPQTTACSCRLMRCLSLAKLSRMWVASGLSEAVFEHGERPRDGRLRQAEKAGAFGHTAGLHNSGELDQVTFVKFHSNSLYCAAIISISSTSPLSSLLER